MPIILTLTAAERIQSAVGIITLIAVLVAFFKDKFWQRWDRPKIKMEFDKENDRCYRSAHIDKDIIQDVDKIVTSDRQYYRLRIFNDGGKASNLKVIIDVYDSGFQQAKRFEPSLLRWVSGEDKIDLSHGEDNYINLLSFVIRPPEIKNRLRVEITDYLPRAIAWDRPAGQWIFKVSIYGDNLKNAVTKYWQYIPSETPDNPGDIKEIKMKEGIMETIREKFNNHIGTLMSILYGLAIATGAEHIILRTEGTESANFPPGMTKGYMILLAAGAVLTAFADWAIYHCMILKAPYRNIWRFLLDIIFPILIFILIICSCDPIIFSICLAIYFTLSKLYIYSIRNIWKPPKWYQNGLWLCIILGLGVIALLIYGNITIIGPIIAFISCAIYATMQGKILNGYLKES
jgi:hypothetical protein